jgi:hypothetical protein
MQSSKGHEPPDLVTIRQFGNMSEALLAQGCLDSAGIESFLADVNTTRFEWPITRGMRLQVDADDAGSPWWNSRGPRCGRRPVSSATHRRRQCGTLERRCNKAGSGRRRNPKGGQDSARQLCCASSQMTGVDFLLAPRSRTKSCPRGLARVPPRTACAAIALLEQSAADDSLAPED